MIKENKDSYSLPMMCRVLQVSRSGYYDWQKRIPSARELKNAQLASTIKQLFDLEKSRAGARRIAKQLNAQGEQAGRHRIARIMRKNGWRARAAKKYKATTNSNHTLPVAPNLLRQDFTASKPNEKWAGDITYIWTEEGWLYLAVIIDLYSRKVIGWSLSSRMTAALVCEALQMASWRRQKPKGVIVHSDRGSQYCASLYQRLLKEYGLICSMSKRGDCYDNAVVESWNHSFKVEAIHGEKFLTREIAKNHIFEYIEIYYNKRRLHSSLGYFTPQTFEEKWVA